MYAPEAPSPPRAVTWSSSAKLLAMFLLIMGAKLWTLWMSSAPLPIYDQWEAEGQRLLLPWLRGELHPGDLFAPWNQHRILWTRLLVLGLFEANGQWDTQVQAIASGLIHAGTALLLGILLIRRLGRAWEDAILLCLVLLFALPIGLQNTLSGGFQSQYYFLLLFAVVTVWGLASHRPGTAGWWLGVAGAVSAWFSVAAGALPALAVAAYMGLRLLRRDGSWREHATTLAVALVLGASGLAVDTVGIPQFTVLRPHSLGELLIRFAGLLGWPNPTAWAAPLAYAPFMCLLWRAWRGRQEASRAEAFLIPLGFFTLLNTAATAYARNHYGDLQVSRYMDLLSYGALVNFACLLLLLREQGEEGAAPRVRAPLGLLLVVWGTATGFGLIQLTARSLANTLPFVQTCSKHELVNTAAFVARPDPRKLADKSAFDVLCEHPEIASALLQDPAIRRILPAQVCPPIPLEAATVPPFVHQVKPEADNDRLSGWVLEPSHNQWPVHFRSRTISGLRLAYLRFPEVSDLGSETLLALVDERSGATTWLPEGEVRNGWQSILVKTPGGPFHVEAVVPAGSERRLAFSYPREVGRLSAWVEPVLGSASWLLSAGCALWLVSVCWRRLGLHALGEIRFYLPDLAWKWWTIAPRAHAENRPLTPTILRSPRS